MQIGGPFLSSLHEYGPDPFTDAEVDWSLMRMQVGKCPGPDQVLVEMLCIAWVAILAQFLLLFNRCLYEGKFPHCWKVALVVPILKP